MKKIFILRIAAILVCCLAASLPVFGQRAIPDDSLAYPVLVTLGNGSSGSGFYLNTANAVFLVTAKHVLIDPTSGGMIDQHMNLLSYSKDPNDSTQNLVSVDLNVLQSDGDIKPHETEDVVVVRLLDLAQPGAPQGTMAKGRRGVTITQIAAQGLLGASPDTTRKFAEVLAGNDVMLFGYPISLGLQQVPQLDYHRPLLRKGIVAGLNPVKRSIVIDCPSYFGNSGGPVVEVDRQAFGAKFWIIGVVVQYVPFVQTAGTQTFAMQINSNSGYSIVVPMDFVLELVN